jgi:hypothetical protein
MNEGEGAHCGAPLKSDSYPDSYPDYLWILPIAVRVPGPDRIFG